MSAFVSGGSFWLTWLIRSDFYLLDILSHVLLCKIDPICYSYRFFIICNTHMNIFVWYTRNMLPVGWKLFSCWICNKIAKCTWQNPWSVRKLEIKFSLSDVFNLQKGSFSHFYPTDLVNTKTTSTSGDSCIINNYSRRARWIWDDR